MHFVFLTAATLSISSFSVPIHANDAPAPVAAASPPEQVQHQPSVVPQFDPDESITWKPKSKASSEEHRMVKVKVGSNVGAPIPAPPSAAVTTVTTTTEATKKTRPRRLKTTPTPMATNRFKFLKEPLTDKDGFANHGAMKPPVTTTTPSYPSGDVEGHVMQGFVLPRRDDSLDFDSDSVFDDGNGFNRPKRHSNMRNQDRYLDYVGFLHKIVDYFDGNHIFGYK